MSLCNFTNKLLCSGLNDSLDSDADTNTSLLKGEQKYNLFLQVVGGEQTGQSNRQGSRSRRRRGDELAGQVGSRRTAAAEQT